MSNDFETHPIGTAQRIKELTKALSWLAGEVERDHELGRLSIDSEDCAKEARKALQEPSKNEIRT